MNPTEIVLAGAVVLWLLVGPRPVRTHAALAMASVVAAGLVLAGPRMRWQLWPLLAAVVVVTLVTLRDARVAGRDTGHVPPPTDDEADGDPTAASGRPRRDGWRLTLAGVALTALLTWVLPVPALELEPGSDPVGTAAFDLVDEGRRSPSTTAPMGTPRRITVQAWWPAVDTDGPPLALTDDGPALADAAGGFLGLPPLVLGHLDTIRTSARVGTAPATTEQLPVVVSLHGWGGFRFAQVTLLEQLAADGFLVLAIDHTYGAVAAQPVAGGVVPIDEALLPDDAPDDEYDAASTVLEDTFRADAATLLAAIREGDSAVADQVLVHADLDRLVVMGHSTGGGAAVWWCAEEPACDGVLTWDPWVEPLPPEQRAAPPTVPWLSVLSQDWIGDDNDGVLRPMVAAAPAADVLAIAGTEHRDVTVQPLLSPLAPSLGLAGELPKERTDEIALRLTRAFLADVLAAGPGDPDDLRALPVDVIRP